MPSYKMTPDLQALLAVLPDDLSQAINVALTLTSTHEVDTDIELVIELHSHPTVKLFSGDTLLLEKPVKSTDIESFVANLSAVEDKLEPLRIKPKAARGVKPITHYVQTLQTQASSYYDQLDKNIQSISIPKLEVTLFLAGLPSYYVFKHRWLDINQQTDNFSRIWHSIEWLENLHFPNFFIAIFPCLIFLLLIQANRQKNISGLFKSILRDEIPSIESPPVDETQKKTAKRILIGSTVAYAVLLTIRVLSKLNMDHQWISIPIEIHIDLLLLLSMLGFSYGWILYDPLIEKFKTLLKQNRGRWFAMGLVHAAMLVLLSELYTQSSFPWLALVFALLAGANLYRYRKEIHPTYWLVTLALVIYTYQINGWWFSIIGDEYAFFRRARSIVDEHKLREINQWFFRSDGVYSTHPYFSSFIQSISMKLFGTSNFGWRFSSLYLSAVAIFPFYYFFRTFFNRKPALSVTFLLATSHYIMSFGKIGYNNLQSYFALSLVLAGAAFAIRTRKLSAYAITGAAVGFCFYIYPAALYTIPLPFLLLLFYTPPTNKETIKRWGVLIFVSLVFLLPILLQEAFTDALMAGTLLNKPDLTANSSSTAVHFITNLIYTLFSPLYIIRESHFVALGYIDPLSAGFAFLGFSYLVWRFRKKRFLIFFMVSLAYLVLVAGTTHDREYPPNTRMYLLLPWFVTLAYLGFSWLIKQAESTGLPKHYGDRILVGLVLLVGVVNFIQAYPISKQRSTGYHVLNPLTLRTAQEIFTSPEDDSTIAILLDSETTHIHLPTLYELFDLYQVPYEPEQMVSISDGAELSDESMQLLGETDTYVLIDPDLADGTQQGYVPQLVTAGKVDCPIMVRDDVRFHFWYSEASNWMCPNS
jgi:4-amino-4-deoxy-L-arabinose transferase-like glycosyltransferase